MRKLPDRLTPRTTDAPTLIVRIGDPVRIDVVAGDLDQQHRAQAVARAVLWLLDALQREREAA